MQERSAQVQPPPAPQAPTAADIRDQIRQQIQNAQAATRDAIEGQAPEPAATQRTVISVPPDEIPDIPPRVADVAMAFFMTLLAMVVLTPIARAVGRWMDRRGQAPRMPSDVGPQLNQLTQAVDAIALEVERISEGQRFTTKLLAEMQDRRAALSAPPRDIS